MVEVENAKISPSKLNLLLGGNVLLSGKLFNAFQTAYGHDCEGPGTLWDPLLRKILNGYDGTIVNLPTSISARAHLTSLNPRNISWLTGANVKACCLANTEVLSSGLQGLLDTQDSLDNADIGWMGAGLNLKEAMKPTYIYGSGGANAGGICVAIIGSAFNNSRDPVATKDPECDSWGISATGFGCESSRKLVLKNVRRVKKTCDLLIFNLVCLDGHDLTGMRRYAHQLIDNGADIVHGHGPEHLLPLEDYTSETHKGRRGIIFYSLGNLIDDGIDKTFRSDLGILANISISSSNSSHSKNCRNIRWKCTGVYPIKIRNNVPWVPVTVDIARTATDRAFIKDIIGPDVHIF